MKGEWIPQNDHVARYCKPSTLDDGKFPTGASFQLRSDEEYLSVNWMEKLGKDRNDQLEELKNVMCKKMTLGSNAKFSVLKVETIIKHVSAQYARDIRVLHEPININENETDESHCGIYDMKPEEDLIAELIAELVVESGLYLVKDI